MYTVAVAGLPGRTDNYTAALRRAGMDSVVTLDRAEAARCDGLLLPGGGDIHPARFGQENAGSRDIDEALDQAQLAILDAFVQAEKPVLGICRGHQLVNVYFGGDLIQDLPTASDHMARERVDSVHPVRVEPGTALYGLYGPDAAVNSSHHQGLGRLGAGLRAAAFAPDGVIEAAEHRRLPILAVQFHPERMVPGRDRPATAEGAPVFALFRRMLGGR